MKKKLLCLLGAAVMSFTAYGADVTTDVVVLYNKEPYCDG